MKVDAKKQLKNLNRRIARANKTFEKLTPAQKRVQIARDVLAQLKSKRLIAANGIWLDSTPFGAGTLFTASQLKKNLELQEVLKKRKQCSGCAMGGLFMCAVERANKLKLKDIMDSDNDDEYAISGTNTFNYLSKFFEGEQLAEIETAFERGQGAHRGSSDAISFAQEEEDPGERMRLIMENIIINDGEFLPDQDLKIKYITIGFEG